MWPLYCPWQVNINIICILKLRKLKVREAMWLVWDQTASKGICWDLNPGCSDTQMLYVLSFFSIMPTWFSSVQMFMELTFSPWCWKLGIYAQRQKTLCPFMRSAQCRQEGRACSWSTWAGDEWSPTRVTKQWMRVQGKATLGSSWVTKSANIRNTLNWRADKFRKATEEQGGD